MASAKEIRTQIKSIKNTQKITKAMEMVAAAKMRKAQERMVATRPYAEKIRNVIGHLANAHPEYQHPYLVERDVKRVGFIVISTDRGLCGGLNTNTFKTALGQMKEYAAKNVEIDLCVVGNKGSAFFSRLGSNIVAKVSDLGDAPHLTDIVGSVKVMLDAYDEGKLDKLILVKNNFLNAMSQKPQAMQLLPVEAMDDESLKHHWDYIYEPDSKEVMNELMIRYVESLVYQAVVENVACEMSSRMIAMKNATDNAGKFIKELNRVYNKARQAAITQEISEIVGGAAAVSG